MAIVKILQYPDPRLRRVGERVTEFDDRVAQMINDMFDTHYAAENCAALASTQLDFEHPKRITVIDFSENKDSPLCLVNADIIERSGEVYEEEGCMSVGKGGHVFEKIKRSEKITVRALDRDGKPLELEADGFMAKCIQHELDHLDGILYIDKLSKLKRDRLEKKLAKLKRHQVI